MDEVKSTEQKKEMVHYGGANLAISPENAKVQNTFQMIIQAIENIERRLDRFLAEFSQQES